MWTSSFIHSLDWLKKGTSKWWHQWDWIPAAPPPEASVPNCWPFPHLSTLFPSYPQASWIAHVPTPNLLRAIIPSRFLSTSAILLFLAMLNASSRLYPGQYLRYFPLKSSCFCEVELFLNFFKALRIILDNAYKELSSVQVQKTYFSH